MDGSKERASSTADAGTSGSWRRGAAAPALVFFSSGAVLVIEILAGRLVAPYVGVSLETYTGVIGTVLAGIAIGSAVGGRAADRHDPRVLLGPVLVAAGAASFAALPVIDVVGPGVASTGGGPIGIVAIAVLAFVLPTALLSAVTPMVAKLRLASPDQTGAVVGGLSAAGTAGALAGTFATGFVFISAWPTRRILTGVALALVVTGVAVTLLLRRRLAAGLLVVAAFTGVAGVVVPSPCERDTRYFCAAVVADPDRPTGRFLYLDDVRHIYVDLADPTHLEFRYGRLIAAVVDGAFGRKPLAALHVGGGGFTLPRWLDATHPGSTSTVLELDPDIVTIGREELGLRLGPRLRVRTGDARLNIADERSAAYDLVVGDAFGGLSVPWHLTTVEMVLEIRRVLVADGLYVMNVIDDGPRALVRAELATLAEVFDHVGLIAPATGGGGNFVLVAGDRTIPLGQFERADGTPMVGAEVERFVAGAAPLRDDFAPADQLMTRS